MTVHHFQPVQYHTTIGSHAPVLHIADGDTVITTTVDAGGSDAHGVKVTPGGNPQTGPFYMEGAEPGDTLMVSLDRITPNRERGWSRAALAPNVVDPEYVAELPPRELAEWHVDTAAGIATLLTPATRLGNMEVPLTPMLGCFGVAPADGQAISTATSAEHGGNMDYRGFAEGVKVFFPVLVPGALFHLGDGHAAQGDGEIVGTGIEISLDVTFTVHLQKGRQIGWPRGENEDFIFTAGNARPLDQALQHATTEMLRWLQQEYGLDPVGASILMGQYVQYEVGNVFDPAYTMICKLPRRVLPPTA
ncbi:MAG TPA: acetamidase/formamidase family protein [Herpetosiphonaceae bacterium]|nr:acetamidase/formamidase family protein [Herpetosiphonaceae bacterium]